MATFQYPLDFKSVNYNATISFQAIKLRAVDVASVLGVFNSFQSQEDQVDTLVASGVDRGLAVASTRSVSATEVAQHRGRSNQTIEGTGQEIEDRLQSCKLYLPQAIQISDGAQYENINLGVMGGSTAQALEQGANVGAAILEGVTEGASGIIDAFRSRSLGAAQARLAVSRASQLLPGQQATGAVQSTLRTVVNPNTRAIFRSVPLREFTFTFKMIPTSSAEAKMITAIINFFRTELYPTVIRLGNDGTEIQAGYEFPNVFEISMMYKDKKQLATRILPSYLRNFTASYNASAMGFHEDGEFTEVDISMTFVESSTLHKELIGKGY